MINVIKIICITFIITIIYITITIVIITTDTLYKTILSLKKINEKAREGKDTNVKVKYSYREVTNYREHT